MTVAAGVKAGLRRVGVEVRRHPPTSRAQIAVLTSGGAKVLLRQVGLDVRRYRPAWRRRIAALADAGVRTVVDVGANTGQFGGDLRRSGFTGRIVSLEPLEGAYRDLAGRAAGDPEWRCVRLAASDRAGTARINVAGNSASSSLLPMARLHDEAMPVARIVGAEQVPLARLDELAELREAPDPLMLKLDVQGHEAAVLEGATGILDRVVLIEAELSIARLYEGAPLMPLMLERLAVRGFELVALEPGFYDRRDGRTLQVDGLFRRVGGGGEARPA